MLQAFIPEQKHGCFLFCGQAFYFLHTQVETGSYGKRSKLIGKKFLGFTQGVQNPGIQILEFDVFNLDGVETQSVEVFFCVADYSLVVRYCSIQLLRNHLQ